MTKIMTVLELPLGLFKNLFWKTVYKSWQKHKDYERKKKTWCFDLKEIKIFFKAQNKKVSKDKQTEEERRSTNFLNKQRVLINQ